MTPQGEFGILSQDEEAIIGLGSPVSLTKLSEVVPTLLDEVDAGINELSDRRMTDDDEMLPSDRATIIPDLDRLERQQRILERIRAQLNTLLVSEAEDFLKSAG